MIYLTLDTDAWIRLLKEVKEDDVSGFDHLMYWIENNHLKYILPENIKNEWDRTKEKTVQEIKVALTALKQTSKFVLADDRALNRIDGFDELIRGRIKRVDRIFERCEIAPISEQILIKSGKRNLELIAPNHVQDSYRDTVNILSLIEYLKNKGYEECYFSSYNSKDYSELDDQKKLHNHLVADFADVNLEYSHDVLELIFLVLREKLPDYINHLKQVRSQSENKKLVDRASKTTFEHDDLDKEFLGNIQYIDLILANPAPTSFEKQILKILIDSHKSYDSYFLKKVGNNGLV